MNAYIHFLTLDLNLDIKKDINSKFVKDFGESKIGLTKRFSTAKERNALDLKLLDTLAKKSRALKNPDLNLEGRQSLVYEALMVFAHTECRLQEGDMVPTLADLAEMLEKDFWNILQEYISKYADFSGRVLLETYLAN